jgi:ribose 5-phosphate isomerase B
MKIAIGADHAGYEEKERLKPVLKELGVEFEDFGAISTDSVDYPDFAAKVARKVADGEFDQGLLVCSSGTGMAIAANKVHGIRAAVAWNEETARLAREHNNVNVLAVGANTTPHDEIPKIVRAWLEAKFAGGRHERRVEKIRALEEGDTVTQ